MKEAAWPFVTQALALDAVERLAVALAHLLEAGDAVTLEGEMGAGKTAFARALIHAIAPGKPEVTSPTYTLMQSYPVSTKQGGLCPLWHLDLYRLEEERDVVSLGLEELTDSIMLVEWPGLAWRYLPRHPLRIAFAFVSADTRIVSFSGNDAWRERLAGVIWPA